MAKRTFLLMAIPLAIALGGCAHGGGNARAAFARPAVVRQTRDQLIAQSQARQNAAQMKKDFNNFTKGIRNTLGLK